MASDKIESFRDELIVVFQKSQEAFEKQFSFIAGGSLTLSVGFIQNIVGDLEIASFKVLLGLGWLFLSLALLLNLISHLISSRNSNISIREINEGNYAPQKIEKRNKGVVNCNVISVVIIFLGIFSIISFITINIIL